MLSATRCVASTRCRVPSSGTRAAECRRVPGTQRQREHVTAITKSLPDVTWPAARSAALWAFCRRQNAPEGQRETTKSHASGKIKNRSFRILRMGYDVFFDADTDSELRITPYDVG